MGFRWWTRKTADDLGLVGTVRNRPDGTVEVMARGEEKKLDRFADKLRKGPTMARVDRVERLDPDVPTGLRSFVIES